MDETKKDPVKTLSDADIVSTKLTRRSLLAQTGLALGLAGAAVVAASTRSQAQAVDADAADPDVGDPDSDDDVSDPDADSD